MTVTFILYPRYSVVESFFQFIESDNIN